VAAEPPTVTRPSGGPDNPTLLERAGTAAAGVGDIGADRPRARRFAEIALVVLIVGFLAGFVATQWSSLPDFEWRFEPGWLVASIAAIAAFYLFQGELWRRILRDLGEPLSRRDGLAVWGKSLLARYVPTSALMVVGRVVLGERYGVTKRVNLASMVYELGLALGAAVIAGAYFVITMPRLQDQPARFAILAIVPIALIGLHPRVFRPLADWGLKKLGRDPLPKTLSFVQVLVYTALFLAVWGLIGFAVFAFAAALHPVDTGDLPYIAGSYAVAFCVAVLTFVIPGGLGTRDAALAIALAAVLPGTAATAIAVAFRIVQTAVELVFVGAVTVLTRGGPSAPARSAPVVPERAKT